MSTAIGALLLFGSCLSLIHLDIAESQSAIITCPKTQKKMPDTKDLTSANSSTPATAEEHKAVLRKHLEEVDDRLAVLYEKREYSYGHKRQLIGYEVRHWESERKEAQRKLEVLMTNDSDMAKGRRHGESASQNQSDKV